MSGQGNSFFSRNWTSCFHRHEGHVFDVGNRRRSSSLLRGFDSIRQCRRCALQRTMSACARARCDCRNALSLQHPLPFRQLLCRSHQRKDHPTMRGSWRPRPIWMARALGPCPLPYQTKGVCRWCPNCLSHSSTRLSYGELNTVATLSIPNVGPYYRPHFSTQWR